MMYVDIIYFVMAIIDFITKAEKWSGIDDKISYFFSNNDSKLNFRTRAGILTADNNF